MIVWLISGIVSIAKKDLGVRRSFLKLISATLGTMAVLPILWEFLIKFKSSEAGLGLLFANLPAFLITSAFYSETRNYLTIMIIIFYPLFSFIGGWGIGQFLELILARIRK